MEFKKNVRKIAVTSLVALASMYMLNQEVSAQEIDKLNSSTKTEIVSTVKSSYDYVGDNTLEDFFSEEENRFFKVPKGYNNTKIIQDLFRERLIKNPELIEKFQENYKHGNLYYALALKLPVDDPDFLLAGDKVDKLAYVKLFNSPEFLLRRKERSSLQAPGKLSNQEPYSQESKPEDSLPQKRPDYVAVHNEMQLYRKELEKLKKKNDEPDSDPNVKVSDTVISKGEQERIDNYKREKTEERFNNLMSGKRVEHDNSRDPNLNDMFYLREEPRTITDIATSSKGQKSLEEVMTQMNVNPNAPFEIKTKVDLNLKPNQDFLSLYDDILNFNTSAVENKFKDLSEKPNRSVDDDLGMLLSFSYLVSGSQDQFVERIKDYSDEIHSKEGKRFIKELVELDLYSLAKKTSRSIKFAKAIDYLNILKNAALLGGINIASGSINLAYNVYEELENSKYITDNEKGNLFFIQTFMNYFPDSPKFDDLKFDFMKIMKKYCFSLNDDLNTLAENYIDEGNLKLGRDILKDKKSRVDFIINSYSYLEPDYFRYIENEINVSSQILEVIIRQEEKNLSAKERFIVDSQAIDAKKDVAFLDNYSGVLNGKSSDFEISTSATEQDYNQALEKYQEKNGVVNFLKSRKSLSNTNLTKNLILSLAVNDFSNLGEVFVSAGMLSGGNALIETAIETKDYTKEEKDVLYAGRNYLRVDEPNPSLADPVLLEMGKIYLKNNDLDVAYNCFSLMKSSEYEDTKSSYLEKTDKKIASSLLDNCEIYLKEGEVDKARELYRLVDDREVYFFDSFKKTSIKNKLGKLSSSDSSSSYSSDEIKVESLDY